MKSESSANFGYYINLDERGSFFADVRNEAGASVFEIHDFDIFEDGFMRHKNDLDGLKDYLVDLNILAPQDRLLPNREFEALNDLDEEDEVEEDETISSTP